jgi:hypothetical protein
MLVAFLSVFLREGYDFLLQRGGRAIIKVEPLVISQMDYFII